jgi:hypothetical protein
LSRLFEMIDNFCPRGELAAVWRHIQTVRLEPVPPLRAAWTLADGRPYAGPPVIVDRNRAALMTNASPQLRRLLSRVMKAAEKRGSLVPKHWLGVACRPYIYPVGTSLAWHQDDHTHYAGSFIYYAHPSWSVSWGGELLVSDELDDAPSVTRTPRLDSRRFSETIIRRGSGAFVMPRPNRLVMLGSAYHSIAPVRAAAGEHVRASIAGFFLTKEGLRRASQDR